MDRGRRCAANMLRGCVWGASVGLHSESVRFEEWRRGRLIWGWRGQRSLPLNPPSTFFNFVVGLHRTGKSCRLRWVNYLNPSLKRGRLSLHEQRLVVELHALWGNRWSRIAKRLPGRTDNEIKNYWRTHTRKKAQENKKRNDVSTSSLSSTPLGSSRSASPRMTDSLPIESRPEMFKLHDAINKKKGADNPLMVFDTEEEDWRAICYPMEQLWDDIAASELNTAEANNLANCNTVPSSPRGDFYWDSLWQMNA